MNLSTKLPENFEKTINELARAREKAAKQKYLLDLGESLVMHLCAFILGEYKNQGNSLFELEKSFIKNNKNLSFGIYLGWLREASKYLNKQNVPSKIHQLLHGQNELSELIKFIKMFEAIKDNIESQKSESFSESIQKLLKNNLGKTNMLQFFDVFIQLRNRIAHPHKEINGKVISWPFSEEYFDATNPFLYDAVIQSINQLSCIWEFRDYVVESNEEGLLILKNQYSEELKELNVQSNLSNGIKVLANNENTILLSDWRLLLKAGDEAIEKIRKEEDDLRSKASIEELKISIKSALDDQQISLEELNFFESLAKTKLGISKQEVKEIILEVAKQEGIDDPFPEVDKRFIEMIDNSIENRTYNEFVLKLTAQNFGINQEDFERIFNERTFILNVSPDEVRKNKIFQMSQKELKIYQDLMRAQQWIYTIGVYNKSNKESQFKISQGNSDEFGTKEFWHKNAFVAVENFVKMRIQKLIQNPEDWELNINQWQQGNMSGYAWCSIYPVNALTHKFLALDLGINNSERLSGSVLIGFLPDWKDRNKIENYGLLKAIFVRHLLEFAEQYIDELENYPNLKLWDSANSIGNYSLYEIYSYHNWFFKYLYSFDEIQFVISMNEIIEQPNVIQDNFDIAFNLFNGLFDGVIRDYKNLLESNYVIQKEEALIKSTLLSLYPLFEKYGLQSMNEIDASLQEVTDQIEIQTDGIKGGAEAGAISIQFKTREDTYPFILNFAILQDYDTNKIYYRIYISCAGYVQSKAHLAVEKVMQSMMNFTYENVSFYFMRSKLVAIHPIDDISDFNPTHFTNFFLKSFSEKCAYSSTSFQGLKIYNAELIDYEIRTNEKFTLINQDLSNIFGNKIICGRNWMRGYRYLDYVESNKVSYHWLGWGLFYKKEQLFAGVVFGISNSLTGAVFKEQMEFKSMDSEWELVTKDSVEEMSKYWIANTLKQNQYKSKGDLNKNHTARHSNPQNQRSCWKPLKNDNSQWIQIDLFEVMEIHSLKILGAPNGSGWVTLFHLKYSTDGKKWVEIKDLLGLVNFNDIKEINFSVPLSAKHIQIHPVNYEKSIALRFDLLVMKIVPAKLEIQWLKPISDFNLLDEIFESIKTKILEIKSFKSIGF